MKKVLIFLILLFTPFIAKADGISRYDIDATVLDNGDLLVKEYFVLDGSFNGFERIINYENRNASVFNKAANEYGGSTIHNGTGIQIVAIKGMSKYSRNLFHEQGTSFKKVKATDSIYGVYTLQEQPGRTKVKIYLPSSKNEAFYIEYIIKNMAIKHKDVGELGFNIVGSELTEDVRRLTMTLHLPNNKEVLAWAHGPLNGTVKIINSETVEVKINNLPKNTPIDVRTAFELDVIKNSTKTTDVEALSKILTYEERQAEIANNEREHSSKSEL